MEMAVSMNTEEDEVTEKEAGWSFLRMYGKDDESDVNSACDDSDFSGKEIEESEEEEESEFDDESEEDSDFDGDEDLDEQGMDWDEMERKAAADDKKRSLTMNDDNNRKLKRVRQGKKVKKKLQ